MCLVYKVIHAHTIPLYFVDFKRTAHAHCPRFAHVTQLRHANEAHALFSLPFARCPYVPSSLICFRFLWGGHDAVFSVNFTNSVPDNPVRSHIHSRFIEVEVDRWCRCFSWFWWLELEDRPPKVSYHCTRVEPLQVDLVCIRGVHVPKIISTTFACFWKNSDGKNWRHYQVAFRWKIMLLEMS